MDTYEYLLIMKELSRLFRDYEKCSDPGIKREICTDIELLSEVIAS